MTMNGSSASFFMLLLMVGVVVGSENYLDYGDETAERNLENLREFYRMLLRRNTIDNVGLIGAGLPYEHLMIRKSQRSPSLRLRFGRSEPGSQAAILTRPSGAGSSAFDDN